MPGLNPLEIARKADDVMTYAGLGTDGGALADKQLDGVRAIMQKSSRLLEQSEVVFLDQAKMVYDYDGFTGTISFPVSEETAFPAELEKGLTGIKVSFDCKKYGAKIPLTDKVVRNHLNKGTLVSFMLSQAIPRVALDCEIYAIQSDTGGGVEYYTTIDGLLARPTSHVLSPSTAAAAAPQLWNDMLITMPSQYRVDKANMRYYVSPNTEQAYIFYLQSQTAQAGYDYIEQDKGFRCSYSGIPIMPLEGMPDGKAILTHRKNVVIAFEKKWMAEPDREPAYPRTVYYLWYWFDCNYAVEDAVVYCDNVEISVASTD